MRLVTALRNGAIDVVVATDGGHVFDSNALPLWSERILLALPEGHLASEEDHLLDRPAE